MVTTALGSSRLWATVGQGIVNEVYWPDTGSPRIRDLGFIVADDKGWWVEVKLGKYLVVTREAYLPPAKVVHTVVREGKDCELSLEFLPDPDRDVLLVRYALAGEGLRLYPLLASHLTQDGWHNDAWVDRGLFAAAGKDALCLLGEPGFRRMSVGYFGHSDGWQDFNKHGRMTWEFGEAEDGNVTLMGELEGSGGVLALAFAHSREDARAPAERSVTEGYGSIRECFLAGWEAWHDGLSMSRPRRTADELWEMAERSAMVLKVHADRTYPGATVASLSIPWGETNNDPYHFVWPRDAVETGFGLLAIGEFDSARQLLDYLAKKQLPDGHWHQNFHPTGQPRWTALQLDEVGLPILLAAKLRELDELGSLDVTRMVKRAAEFIEEHGPASPQDRWEENDGLSPFTLAVEIAALVAATSWLDTSARKRVLAKARSWNEQIEEWTYVQKTRLTDKYGVDGYYIRIAPSVRVKHGSLTIANGGGTWCAEEIVALDFLYLARLGLREVDDERIQNTLKVVDGELKVVTPRGVAYHRFQHDGYGEQTSGAPYSGSGIGRAWPLLAGERGHAALLCGGDRTPYLEAMVRMSGPGGLIPEQVWDDNPPSHTPPHRPGGPTGSAMPLVWAHSEFLKLLLAPDQRPLELLEIVTQTLVNPSTPIPPG